MTRLTALVLFAACVVPGGAWAQAQPIVLELFTSQACSSCPPADRLLSVLAQQPGLLALDMHVDYWNGIGWHDPYALAAVSQRQSRYAALLGQDSVYTPELVVGGRYGVVGSDSAAVAAAIGRAVGDAARTTPVALEVHRQGAGVAVTIGAGRGDATVWVVGYDTARRTQVRGGENAGRTLSEVNVVTSLAAVAHWTGAAVQVRLAAAAGEGTAVLLQAADGHMVAAAVLGPG